MNGVPGGEGGRKAPPVKKSRWHVSENACCDGLNWGTTRVFAVEEGWVRAGRGVHGRFSAADLSATGRKFCQQTEQP